jgi:hypothetical protein
VPSNLTKGTATAICSAIIFGNFADLVIGLWGGLDLMVDPYSKSTTGAVRIVCHAGRAMSLCVMRKASRR